MARDTKQPVYEPGNLINFERKNIWLNSVKNSRTRNDKFTSAEIVMIGVIIFICLVVMHYAGIIETA